jgi:serine/threonine protein phosphatase, putative
MDGGAVYGGVLHGVLFGHNGIIERYAIKNDCFAAEDE